jgi:hypothetical protein
VSDYVDYDPWMTSPGAQELVPLQPVAVLLEACPNPFYDNIHIRFTIYETRYMMEEAYQDIRGPAEGLSEYQKPALGIYDATGRLVKYFILPTTYCLLPTVVSWDGTDSSNGKLGSGVYFVQLRVGDWMQTKKLVFLR